VFQAKGKRGLTALIPPPYEGIERVSSLTVLGVVINDRMTAADHVSGFVDIMLEAAVCIASIAQSRNIGNVDE